MKAALPVIRDLRTLASAAKPVGTTLAGVLESFQKTGGIERAMDYIFFQVAAINGFDSFGHYLRAGLIVNQCSTYAITRASGLLGQLRRGAAAPPARSSAARRRARARPRMLRRTTRRSPASGSERQPTARPAARRRRTARSAERRRRRHAARRRTPPRRRDAATQATPGARRHAGAAAGGRRDRRPLLDYLFGGDG